MFCCCKGSMSNQADILEHINLNKAQMDSLHDFKSTKYDPEYIY